MVSFHTWLPAVVGSCAITDTLCVEQCYIFDFVLCSALPAIDRGRQFA